MENLDLIKKVHETGKPQGDISGLKYIDSALNLLKGNMYIIGDDGVYRELTEEEYNKYHFIYQLSIGMGRCLDDEDWPTVADIAESYHLKLIDYVDVDYMFSTSEYIQGRLFGPTFVLRPTIYHNEDNICIGYKYIIGYNPGYRITNVVEIDTLYGVVIYDDKLYAPIPKDFEHYEGVQLIWDMFEDIFNFPDIGEPIDECEANGNSDYINFELESL